MSDSPTRDSYTWIIDTLQERMGRGVRLDPQRLWGELFAVDQALGHPGRNIRCIQVVGTNGKGSTSSLLAHALQFQGGRKVGLYTSPHLHRVQERIRINFEAVDSETMAQAMRQCMDAESKVKAGLSFFELLTFSALLCFEAAEVEDIVLEAGLGGRLDATSIRRSDLCLITPIALDHQQYLGDTLLKIAGEKASVMHRGAKVFAAVQNEEVMSYLRERAVASGVAFRKSKPLVEPPNPRMASYQRINAGLALDAFLHLCPQDTLRSKRGQIAKTVFSGYHWPGRMECIPMPKGRGEVVLDVAHNPDGVAAILESVQGQGLHFDRVYLAALADKDVVSMVAALDAALFAWTAVRLEDSQAFDFAKLVLDEHSVLSQSEALADLDARLARGERILVLGSHRWVAKVREHLQEIPPPRSALDSKLSVAPGKPSGLQGDGLFDPLRRGGVSGRGSGDS